MSKLLINEHPLQVLPSLATSIGLNEAIVVQQIHYWLGNGKAKIIDGKPWIYNDYEDWQEQFPFWSVSTIRRTLGSLESQALIQTGNFNKSKLDHTKWYTIDYETLEKLELRSAQNGQNVLSNMNTSSAQNEQMDVSNVSSAIPETTTETTSENESLQPPIGAADSPKAFLPTDTLTPPSKKESATPSKVAQKVSPAKSPSIDQALKDAVAVHLLKLPPETKPRKSGPLAQIAAGHARRVLKREKLTPEEYAKIAENIPIFAGWYKAEYPDLNLPTTLGAFDEYYIKWLQLGKPKGRISTGPSMVPHPQLPGVMITPGQLRQIEATEKVRLSA